MIDFNTSLTINTYYFLIIVYLTWFILPPGASPGGTGGTPPQNPEKFSKDGEHPTPQPAK